MDLYWAVGHYHHNAPTQNLQLVKSLHAKSLISKLQENGIKEDSKKRVIPYSFFCMYLHQFMYMKYIECMETFSPNYI